MIKRYTRPAMGEIWSEDAKFRNWVTVEAAALRAKAAAGEFAATIPDQLESLVAVVAEEVDRLEREKTRHDMKAFLELTASQLPAELQPYWHDRMTSYDTEDTALGLQLRSSVQEIRKTLTGFMAALKTRALEHKYTPQIGRTHLVHAEPITFGVKLANWYAECFRHFVRLDYLEQRVSVGKLSGAVGMFTLDPEIEARTCESLGLKPVIATQIVSRDIIAEYLATLAVIGGTVKKIADNIRHMQSTEVREAQEYFDPRQTGSSAMPHKRNPISSESVSGLVAILRGNAQAGFALQDDLHERVLCNSAPERVVLPDSSILLDFILARMTRVLEKLIVYPDRMEANLKLTRGLIFSEAVLSMLANKAGIPREAAYDTVKRIAQRCWDSGESFAAELLKSDAIRQHASPADILDCFNLQDRMKHVDFIFRQVFDA